MAAACCGGSSALPGIITGDDAALISASLNHSQILSDVNSQGSWFKKNNYYIQSVQIDMASIFKDLWQVGANFSVVKKTDSSIQYSGVGDLGVSLGYEFLPEYGYNPMTPRGHVFSQLVIPVEGKTIYEMNSNKTPIGKGFYQLGLGMVLSKNYKNYDGLITLNLQKGLEKKINSEQVEGILLPGWGGLLSVSVGYNVAKVRYGIQLQHSVSEPNKINGDKGALSAQQSTQLGLSYAYLVQEGKTLSVSYINQRWLGRPLNTSLSESVLVSYQSRWAR